MNIHLVPFELNNLATINPLTYNFKCERFTRVVVEVFSNNILIFMISKKLRSMATINYSDHRQHIGSSCKQNYVFLLA